ncbi:hypothetical protein CNECB9_1040011 [Cupriavidus necator]|uniref:Uncharacterized protein n=1 Tax=Cupriavidus necator TaxID=106590 RepID=A0A1K0I7X0_CUPNE|nr:hypothetical protein CNECB9_1040011 [Cupriavidus necator]
MGLAPRAGRHAAPATSHDIPRAAAVAAVPFLFRAGCLSYTPCTGDAATRRMRHSGRHAARAAAFPAQRFLL